MSVPSRDQLELQVDILKDYIAKLKENAEKQSAELQANIEKLKADLVAATAKVDPALMTAQKSAQLRELQYAKEKFDIVVDGYREQRIANRVALLLVVIMVIDGIAFSALQLWKGLGPSPQHPEAAAAVHLQVPRMTQRRQPAASAAIRSRPATVKSRRVKYA